jgi:hypothetical protein
MKWASLAVCALMGMLFVVGCQSMGFMGDVELVDDAIGNMRIVDGAPDAVAVTLQNTLKQRKIEAVVSGAGDELVLESKTAAGLRFALVLKRVPGDNGRDQTKVSLQWIDRGDRQVHVQIMSDVDKQPGAKK